MKFGKIMQLWLTGLMLLISAVTYADDEDILTISPAGDAGPGTYEITLSGTRDSDKAAVQSYIYNISISYCSMDEPCCVGAWPSVTVTAAIEKGKNTGKSSYRKTFRIFLDSGMYSFYYRLSGEGSIDQPYRSGTVVMPPNNYGYTNVFFVGKKPSVSLSLQNATGEISSPDSFILRNVAAEMSTGEKFGAWGKFRWNPESWSWELKDGGIQ